MELRARTIALSLAEPFATARGSRGRVEVVEVELEHEGVVGRGELCKSIDLVRFDERTGGIVGRVHDDHPRLGYALNDGAQSLFESPKALGVVLASRPEGLCELQVAAGLRAAGSGVPVVHLMRFLDDPSASLGASTG